MSIRGPVELKKNGRDEVIESLMDGKTPEGWEVIVSDAEDGDEGAEVVQ